MRSTRRASVTPGALRDRAEGGHVREGHGDLRPEHVALDGTPVVIDCLEFNAGCARSIRSTSSPSSASSAGCSARRGSSHGCSRTWRTRARTRRRRRRAGAVRRPPRAAARPAVGGAPARPAAATPERWLPQAARYLAEARTALRALASSPPARAGSRRRTAPRTAARRRDHDAGRPSSRNSGTVSVTNTRSTTVRSSTSGRRSDEQAVCGEREHASRAGLAQARWSPARSCRRSRSGRRRSAPSRRSPRR